MSNGSPLDKAVSFVHLQLEPGVRKKAEKVEARKRPVVTISRQTGAGGHATGEALAAYLQGKAPKTSPPWTLFDRKLVEEVLADHQLPAKLADFMPDQRLLSGIEDVVEELLGMHPASWHLVQQTTETILRLAEMGNVILVGRGASIITGHLPQAFHVRLVGSPEVRAEFLIQTQGLSKRKALATLEQEDVSRKRYIRRYFKRDIDDPLLYDLVVNTDRIPTDEAARIVGDAVLARAS